MSSLETVSAAKPLSRPDHVARRFVHSALGRFPCGRLSVVEPDGSRHSFGSGEPAATLLINDWRTYRMMFTGGGLGAAEAFMEGLWESDGLTDVVRFFAANVEPMQALDRGLARLLKPFRQFLHFLNRNSVSGSRRNIAAHYDLGNDFFKLFLDREMMYSAAIWPDAEASLDEAAVHKLDVICRKLELRPGMTLLEVGTGWGGLAIHAARHYGCQVTTTTISAEQYRHARSRVLREGLEDRVTVLDQDYRLLDGKYDRVVSVEMIEAVGNEYLPGYFAKLDSLVKADGLLLLQAITVPDQRFDHALRNVDFIKRYIFPGGFLPSLTVMQQQLLSQTRLMTVDVHDIGADYGRTLACWRERFTAQLAAVREQGFDEYFIRMWLYYLCYCEGAFYERAISTVQLLAAGPKWRPAAP